MTFTFTILICLGLSLRPRTPVLAGNLPKPTIRVHPDSVAFRGMQVTISCLGTSDTRKYILYQGKISGFHHKMTSAEPGKKAEFLIESLGKHNGGRYYCQYQTTAGWSELSDPLELVVTGVYDNKPSLSAVPSFVVASGENMTLQCISQQGYDKFILTKEDQFSISLDSQYIYSTRQFQALFPVGAVTPSHAGTFRCYGYYKEHPLVWSYPSDALEINVSVQLSPTVSSGNNMTMLCQSWSQMDTFLLSKEGAAHALHLKPMLHPCSAAPASQPQDHTVENLIRMGMAGLVLVILGILLFEAQHRQRKTQDSAGR